MAKAHGATRTPEIFLFDAARMLRYHYLRDAIEAVLTGTMPATAETKPVGCTIKWK